MPPNRLPRHPGPRERDLALGRAWRVPLFASDPTVLSALAQEVETAPPPSLEDGGEVGVFEVDEAWLPLVASQLAPTAIVLGNLFRDRLDDYGELEAISCAWETMASRKPATRLVLNTDDLIVASLARLRDDLTTVAERSSSGWRTPRSG